MLEWLAMPTDDDNLPAPPPPLPPPPPSPADTGRPKSWGWRRIISALGWLAALAAAFLIGTTFNLAHTLTNSWSIFLQVTLIGVVVAFVVLLSLLLVHHRIKRRVREDSGEFVSRLRMLAVALAADRSANTELSPPDTGALVQRAFDVGPRAMAAWLTGRAYWRLFLAVGSIIGAAVLVSQFMVLVQQTTVMAQQTERLTEQNGLIRLEARLAAIARQADLDQQAAARAYDEITRVLDESTSPGAQVYALERLPEAMVMPVTIVDPSWTPHTNSTEPVTRTVYPNLQTLAQRLLLFARQERVPQGAKWTDAQVGSVSTAICATLHRFGFANTAITSETFDEPDGVSTDVEDAAITDTGTMPCIWHMVFDEGGDLRDYPDTILTELLSRYGKDNARAFLVPPPTKTRDGEESELPQIDLRHLRSSQLAEARLQRVNLMNAQIQGIELWGAHMQGAFLQRAQMQGADLTDAQIQEADLTFAHMRRTILNGAQMQGAILHGVEMQHADLTYANTQGASFFAAHMQGAYLTYTQMQGADLTYTQMQGATLSGAQMQGTVLFSTQMQGTELYDVQLQGAELTFTQMQGANLTGAEMQGAELHDVQMQGACLINTSLGNTRAIFGVQADSANQAWVCTPEHSSEDRQIQLNIPPTIMFHTNLAGGIQLPCIPFGGWSHAYSEWIRLALGDGTFDRIWWPDRARAEEYLRKNCSEVADELIELLHEPTIFLKNADLAGVLIDAETLATIPTDACIPAPDIAFAEANMSPEAIAERIENPYVLPSGAELLELLKEQQETKTTDN